RPSGPVQQWIFHQAEQELTTLPGLRYSFGHRKGRLKILFVKNPIRRLEVKQNAIFCLVLGHAGWAVDLRCRLCEYGPSARPMSKPPRPACPNPERSSLSRLAEGPR